MTEFQAAIVQWSSTTEWDANLATAERLVRAAAAAGAQLVVLPELFACLGPIEAMQAAAEPYPGPTSQAAARWARELGIHLVAGSFAELSAEGLRFNTSLLIDPSGRVLARYRKLHLFDIDLPERVTFSESQWLSAGNELSVTATALGTLAQAICYDLRFPALFARQAELGAEVVCLPSAFAYATGCDHWMVLLRARAIENQVYVVAANQFGQHSPGMRTYGHSAIVDPWGNVLAELGEEEGYAVAKIDLALEHEIRRQLPCLKHRRALDSLANVAADDVIAAPPGA